MAPTRAESFRRQRLESFSADRQSQRRVRQIHIFPGRDPDCRNQARCLILIEVPSGKVHRIENGFSSRVAFTADGQRLAGVNPSGYELSFWNPVTRTYMDHLNVSSRLAGQLGFSFDGRTIAASGGANVLHLWDIASAREHLPIADAHEGPVNSAAVTHDGKTLITASDDQTIRLWSIATGRQLKVLNHGNQVGKLCLSRDGRTLLAGMKLGSAFYVWRLAGDPALTILNAANGIGDRIYALAYADRDQSIVTVTFQGILRRWNLKDHRLQSELSMKPLLEPLSIGPGMREMFTSATFFAGGTRLAVATVSSGLHLVDVATGKEIGRVPECASRGSRAKRKHIGDYPAIWWEMQKIGA